MLTLFRLWKLALSRQNMHLAGRLCTFLTLLRIHIQAKLDNRPDGLIQIQFEGYTMVSYSYVTIIELYIEIFIKQAYRFETTIARPIIIDCGANMGMSLLYFKRLYPQCEVWAYEANPDAFTLLQLNVALNKLEGIHLFNYVLSDTDEEVDFYIPTTRAGLNGSLDPTIAKGMKQRLKGYRLSGLMPFNIEIDFVKIDTEGAEFNILAELSESGRLNDIKQYVVELHASSENIQLQYNRLLNFFGSSYIHTSVSDQYTKGYPHVIKFCRKDLLAGPYL
ncbi:methyltransferase, FkbM family [Pontibacter lucknowensis]|uniref:Methyltransferase, FkbM family n=2 Tax=Pontibacter lucknowensis TaxID=1077936 RepID=A0A1N7AND1_9BACT|nr:methyltransferase, FkbM family [Pontibacter lucknowensis]